MDSEIQSLCYLFVACYFIQLTYYQRARITVRWTIGFAVAVITLQLS